MKLTTLIWRTGMLVFCLALMTVQAAVGDQEPPPPPLPGDQAPVEPKPPADGYAPTSGIRTMSYTVPLPDSSTSGVFAPYTGKSPCGEFDVPYNDYFGDTRVHRCVVMGRLWASGEYLAWETKGTQLPPLVTTSPGGTALADAGVLGVAGTTILFGDQEVHDTWRSGGRMNFGYWLTPEHALGIEVDLLWLDGRDIDFTADSADFPILAHPILLGGVPDRILVAFPGVQTTGVTRIESDTELFSIEVLERWMLHCDESQRLDLVGGYRHMRLFDRLRTESDFVSDDISSGFPAGAEVLRTDLFESRNDFHGGEVGLVYRWWNCCWALQATGKLAFGGTHTNTEIEGDTVVDDGVAVTVTPAGVLAQPANIGQYSRNKFAMTAEVGVRGEYAVTPQFRVMMGYNLLWWADAARVPDSIELDSQAFLFQTRDFWAHGLTAGGYYDF